MGSGDLRSPELVIFLAFLSDDLSQGSGIFLSANIHVKVLNLDMDDHSYNLT
ncbi:hypothetical protein SAMN05421639_101621 [Chryseobacterium shigense]|uniref:Uncharacterized protein n=1 Tax=Chryseobacterium shigense TaxID=297244 RepID=A0A1N7HYK7_9FLAO|nr:hypothetical protein SAMN05421639_101621 [Chryseobacterium shigense]